MSVVLIDFVCYSQCSECSHEVYLPKVTEGYESKEEDEKREGISTDLQNSTYLGYQDFQL